MDYFKRNLLYLLDINKKINFQKKNNFCYDIKINPSTLSSWLYHDNTPTKANLERITEYFNKWLVFNIRPDDLLELDLPEILEKEDRQIEQRVTRVAETASHYLRDKEEWQFMYDFRGLNEKQKKLIKDLIKELNKG